MLNVIAIGTPYWIYSSAILRVNYAGLWVFCTKYYLNAVAGCVELGQFFNYTFAIQIIVQRVKQLNQNVYHSQHIFYYSVQYKNLLISDGRKHHTCTCTCTRKTNVLNINYQCSLFFMYSSRSIFFPITDSDFGWVKSIRAMMILSVMFFGAGFVSFTLKIWVLKTRKEFEYLGIASTFAGGLNKNFFD